MTIARAGSAVVTHQNKIYVIGGVDGRIFLSTVEMAEIREDGSLSPWQRVSRMPISRGFIDAAIFQNRVYVLGGGNGAHGKNLLRSIVSAPLLNDGSLGEWRIEAEQLLMPRRCSKMLIHNNHVYTFGGFGGALLDSVEVSTITPNGELGGWRMLDNKLTRPRYVNAVAKTQDYVFVLGGHHEHKGVGINNVEFSHLKDDELSWISTHSLNQGRYAFTSISYNNQIYALGGISGSEYLDSVERLDLSNGLSLASWRQSTKLPQKMANFSAVVSGNNVYLLGGSSQQAYSQAVWYANFNKNGDIGFWGDEAARDAVKNSQRKRTVVSTLRNQGVVLNRIETESYTYMLVETQGSQLWLAAPVNTIAVATRIRFSDGVYMSNFHSKTLNQTFDAILFVGTVETVN